MSTDTVKDWDMFGRPRMKAISLWQPWATAIAVGAKTYETRSWKTNHRGMLAIHASKTTKAFRSLYRPGGGQEMPPHWRAALHPALDDTCRFETLPRGVIVAVVDLIDCIPTDQLMDQHKKRRRAGLNAPEFNWSEFQMGDFAPGRYAWELQNVRVLSEPIPWVGAQGLFNVSAIPFEATELLCQKQRKS